MVSTADRRLRIAMVAAADYDTDARIRRQAESLVQRGDHVTAIVLGERGAGLTRLVRDGVEVIQLPISKYRGDSTGSYFGGYLRYALRTFLHLSRRPRAFDLIEVHSMPEALVFSAVVPRLLGVPVLLDVHDLTSELFSVKFAESGWHRLVRLSERWSMRFASQTITVHDHYVDVIREAHGKAARGLRAVLNSPDEERFSDCRWRPWDEQVLFSFHGTLVHRYGVLAMVEAFHRVRETLPGARLQILGDGDARDDVTAAIRRLDLNDAVVLSDRRVPVDDLPTMIGAAHIGLAPNLLNDFTRSILPTKVLEYVALGIPVIASRLPVLEAYFDDSAIRYVPPGDIESLAAAMIDTFRNPERARERSVQALALLQRVRWGGQRQIYLAVVDTLVAGNAKSTPSSVSV